MVSCLGYSEAVGAHCERGSIGFANVGETHRQVPPWVLKENLVQTSFPWGSLQPQPTLQMPFGAPYRPFSQTQFHFRVEVGARELAS